MTPGPSSADVMTADPANAAVRSPADDLLPALRRLDERLERAMRQGEQLYGAVTTSNDPYRGLYVAEEDARRLLARAPGAPLFAGTSPQTPLDGGRFTRLAAEFGLDPFDLDLAIVALAPELDLRYERVFAYLQDDVTRRRASVDLALNLLCQSASDKIARRCHLLAEAPLRRHGLLHLTVDSGQAAPPLLAHALKLDEQVVRFLLGLSGLDPRLGGFCSLTADEAGFDELLVEADVKRALMAIAAASGTAAPQRLYLQGPAGSGKRSLAAAVARQVGRPLLTLDVAMLPAGLADFSLLFDLALREARFHEAVVYVDQFDALAGDDRLALRYYASTRIGASNGLTFVGGTQAWSVHGRTGADLLSLAVAPPAFATRRTLWAAAMAREAMVLDEPEATRLANRFLFTPRQIARTVASARNRQVLRTLSIETPPDGADAPGEPASALIDDLIASAREQSTHRLGALATRVKAVAGWDDIVLPQDQKAQLIEICNQAEQRYRVYGEWGFDRKTSTGRGLNVMFSGPPGTGKTMAAEVIANRLRLDLYKIDLSQVVSKYIGETEKNVSRVFAEARTSNAILFFDEADALFGRRSEVRDAHDRYANVEIAFLLQQMDDYEGISVLATNLKQNIDEAFLRRLAFTLEFPFPDEGSRRSIWTKAWPAAVPLDPSVDHAFLARTFRFSGGSIRNVVVAASFLGAGRGTVDMADVLRAARRESEKMGRSPGRADYGPWWDAVQNRALEDWTEASAS